MIDLVATALAAVMELAPAPAPSPPAGYSVIDTVKVGGEGGWDYLTFDLVSRRLFVSRGTHVMVLDADTKKLVGDIPDTPGVHGIAIATDSAAASSAMAAAQRPRSSTSRSWRRSGR